jgi:hypothetical protein
MKYKIIDIKKQKSKYGGNIKIIYLKDENGELWKTYLDEKNYNYDKWIHTFDRIYNKLKNTGQQKEIDKCRQLPSISKIRK